MGLGGFGWAEETGRRPDFMDQLLVSREILNFALGAVQKYAYLVDLEKI